MDAVNAQTAYFRGLESASAAYLTVTLNATNHTIVLTIDPTALAAALPQATTSTVGVGETATDAEAQGKVSLITFLTPSNLAALGSSETFAGLIEIANQAETNIGADDTRAITPLKMATYLTNQVNLPDAWFDAAARAAIAPVRGGQFGSQTADGTAWVGLTTLAAGAWNQVFTLGSAGTASNAVTDSTVVDISNAVALSFQSGDGTGYFNFQSDIRVNFDSDARLYNNFAIVPADSLLITSGTAGQFGSISTSQFISIYNTQVGYTAFTNGATLRTCNTAAVTLQQLAQIVGTLIEDLKAIKLPHT